MLPAEIPCRTAFFLRCWHCWPAWSRPWRARPLPASGWSPPAIQNSPYLWRDPQNPGQLIGASADLLELLAKALDVKIDLIRSGSRVRAEENVASGRIDLLLGSFPDSARRASLDFIEPALFVQSAVVWVRKDRVFPYGGWSDLYGHRGRSWPTTGSPANSICCPVPPCRSRRCRL
ncbi:substrate-binding periplasmic protein [Azotobacter sp. CWF10]